MRLDDERKRTPRAYERLTARTGLPSGTYPESFGYEEAYAVRKDTAGNLRWIGTLTGEHVIRIGTVT